MNGSPVGKRSLVEKLGFEHGVKYCSEGVMDDESGYDDREGLTSGESRQDW